MDESILSKKQFPKSNTMQEREVLPEDLNYSQTISMSEEAFYSGKTNFQKSNKVKVDALFSIPKEKIANILMLPSESLLCSICKNLPIVTNFIQCKKCENYFCETCITAIQNQNVNTENSEENNSLKCYTEGCDKFKPKPIDKVIKGLIAKLNIICVNNEQGCIDFIPYEEYLNHLDECQYQQRKCENFNCEEILLVYTYQEHIEICPFRNITCDACNLSDIFLKDLEDHKLVCEFRTYICEEGCKENVFKKDFEEHKETCEKIVISCEVCKTIFMRGEKPKHDCYTIFQNEINQKNVEISNIIQNKNNIENENKKLQNIVEQKDILIASLTGNITFFNEKVSFLEKEIDKYKQINKNDHNVKTNNLSPDLNDTYRMIEALEYQIKLYKEEIFNLRVFNENNNLTIHELKKTIEDLNKKLYYTTNLNYGGNNRYTFNNLSANANEIESHNSIFTPIKTNPDKEKSDNMMQSKTLIIDDRVNISGEMTELNNVETIANQKINQTHSNFSDNLSALMTKQKSHSRSISETNPNMNSVSMNKPKGFSNQCSKCKGEVTIKNSAKCKICKELVCLYCKETCFICFQIFCESHIKNCEKCNNPVCRADACICDGCINTQCNKCFDSDSVCEKCNWQFDINYKEKLLAIENNGYVCRTYNTASCLPHLSVGNKVLTAGYHKWELKIKSPICKIFDTGIIILENNNYSFIFEKSREIEKTFKLLNKISLKQICNITINKTYSSPIIFTLDINNKIFSIEIEGNKFEKSIEGKFFLPFFFVCNNYIILRHIFLLSNS